VAAINGLDPDLIVLAGDIVNDDITPRGSSGCGQAPRAPRKIRGPRRPREPRSLRRRRAKPGLAGPQRRRRSRRQGDPRRRSFYVIAGWTTPRLPGRRPPRRPLDAILAGVDRSYPLILVDHQPRTSRTRARPASISRSRAIPTAGRSFPSTSSNRLVYEDPNGYYRKGATQYYVSSGVGNWGPPMRIGSTAEIVRIRISLRPPAIDPDIRSCIRARP